MSYENLNESITYLFITSWIEHKIDKFTYARVVVILEPPAEPAIRMASSFLSSTMNGHMEESGRLLGSMKFAFEGRRPKPFFKPGDEKSSISSFNMMPVVFERTSLPNLNEFVHIFDYWISSSVRYRSSLRLFSLLTDVRFSLYDCLRLTLQQQLFCFADERHHHYYCLPRLPPPRLFEFFSLACLTFLDIG